MDSLQKIQRQADELGIDVNIGEVVDELPDVEDQGSVQAHNVRKHKILPYNPLEENPENETHKILLESGNQIVLELHYKPRCPTCSHLIADEKEPHNVLGKCWRCENQTCPQCRSICEACGRIMCRDHKHGHGVEDKSYCRICRADILEELEHERRLEKRQEDRLDKELEKEHERQLERLEQEYQHKEEKQSWQQEKERRKLKTERQQKRFDNRYKAKELELRMLKTILQAKENRQRLPGDRGFSEFNHISEIEESVKDKR
jgi:hypothetical protein